MAAYILPGERRGGKVLVYDGYRYQRNKLVAGRKVYWRCTNRHCRVPLHTNDFGSGNKIEVLDDPQPQHSHPPEKDRLDRLESVRKIKTAIRKEPSLPIRRAYDDVLSGLPDDQHINFPHFDEVRTSLQRFRTSVRPVPLPAADLVCIHDGTWAESWGGQRKPLATIDNATGVAVFASGRELEVLEQCSEIFIDGTFRTAPDPYIQIVTMYGQYRGLILPLSISLVTSKLEEQYRSILRAIKREILALTDRAFSPNLVVTDFEVSLINAIGKELPHAESRVCQSLWRKLTEVGLEAAYLRDPTLQRVLGRILGMGYRSIPNAFIAYTNEAGVQTMVQQYPVLQQFIDYVQKTCSHRQKLRIPFWNLFHHSHRNQTQQLCTGQHMESTGHGYPSESTCGAEGHGDPQQYGQQSQQTRSPDASGRRRRWRNLERRVKRLHRACQRLPLDRGKVQDDEATDS